MKNRFTDLEIGVVTLKNYKETLPESLAVQVEMFLPPSGSFDDPTLRRYLENLKNYEEEDPSFAMTLANRLRMAFQDMTPDTICGKFPNADLPLKRRLRCVADTIVTGKQIGRAHV